MTKLSQSEIDALFAMHSGSGEGVTTDAVLSPPPPPEPAPDPAPAAAPATEPERPALFPRLDRVAQAATPANPIDLLASVELDLTARLGQARRSIREILTMGAGSVLELDNQAGEAVDILVNGRLLARGEVVIVGENFGVRIVELVEDPGGRTA